MAKEKNDKAEAAAKVELSPEEAAAKAKKKKLLLIIIGGAVATIGIGGGAAFFLMKGSDKPAAPAGEHAEEAGAEHADPKKEEGKKEDPSAPKKEEAKKDEKGDAKKDEKSASADKKDDKDVPPKLPANVDIGKHCAGATLAAVAAKLGAGQTQLVAQCVSKGFLRSNVYTARLAVHADGQEPLDSAGRPALS